MFNIRAYTLIIFFHSLFLSGFIFSAQPDIEVYGKMPAVRSFSISPDGQHFAYIERLKEMDYFVIRNVDTSLLVTIVEISKFKARSTYFATNNHVVLRVSKTNRTFGTRGPYEHSGALVYNIKKDNVRTLLKGAKDLHPRQAGLGGIIGSQQNFVYMPAFQNVGKYPYNLYKVNLDTGRTKLHARGVSYTIDWFVNDEGKVLAREDFDNNKDEHRIESKISGKWKTIYSHKTSIPSISLQAVSNDEKSLLFIDRNDDREAVYAMSLSDGKISGPLFSDHNSDIDFLKTNINRKLTAVVYSGFKSKYNFTDKRDNELYERLAANFPMSDINQYTVTTDKTKVIINVSGADAAGTYMLYDAKELKLKQLASEYDVDFIAELKVIKYKARDGLKIPAIISYPKKEVLRKNLPLIVLPHGGPESYDKIEFYWLAQYFAAKGYMVLQPNFRGSTGFGYDFRNAGRGRWGKEMQDDVTDGVKTLVAAGYVDPERVCIVGQSYGGYSALAGGAFSPDIYRCVISINGVSDIPQMLITESKMHGSKHWVSSYWQKVIGDRKKEKEKLKNISPVNFPDAFQSPVLLIHGKDDLVVPIKQSENMYKALKKAHKNVSFIKLKGEDHWLSSSASRLAALKSMDAFLNKYNPVDELLGD